MSSAFYLGFCFPFFLVSNNTDRAGCKPLRAGLAEGRGIEKGKGGQRKALVRTYVCITPGVSLKTNISEQSRPCHLRDRLKKHIDRIILNKEWSSSTEGKLYVQIQVLSIVQAAPWLH